MNEVEQVLVVPENVFQEVGGFVGVSREASALLQNEKFLSSLQYLPRSEAEENPSFKQLIPYCVVRFGGELDYGSEGNTREGKEKGLFFIYQRTKKGGETRLYDKYSIGVGGHINPCDGEPSCSFETAQLRELQEEISLSGDFTVRPVGLLYDDSNDVGKVHLGVVSVITLGKNSVMKPNDPALANGTFVDYTWLVNNVGVFENWSQLVIKELL